jgi:hypothetical protein
MSTVLEAAATPLIRYSVTDNAIAELRQELAGLTAETREGYELVRQAIARTRGLRTDIEERRKELNRDALDWQRKVNGEAKRLTGLLLEIEEPLKARKQAVDDEKDRLRREAERAELIKLEDELRAKREAEEAQRLDGQRGAGGDAMSEVLEIRMQLHETHCSLCGEPTLCCWGVPAYNGDLMSNDFPDELISAGGGNQPVCEDCYDRHARGELETFDRFYLWRVGGLIDGAGI